MTTPKNQQRIDEEIRRLEEQKRQLQEKEDELKRKQYAEKMATMKTAVELSDHQKEEAFWTWIYCNAEFHFPEAKRFLGNSDPEADFWELIHSQDKTTEEEGDDDDFDEDEDDNEISYEETTACMAQVIEWGYLQACKKLGKDPYWLHKSKKELRRNFLKETADRRYE